MRNVYVPRASRLGSLHLSSDIEKSRRQETAAAVAEKQSYGFDGPVIDGKANRSFRKVFTQGQPGPLVLSIFLHARNSAGPQTRNGSRLACLLPRENQEKSTRGTASESIFAPV